MVYHCFTDVGIWASLGKAGITKIAYNFRIDGRTAQLCSCTIVQLQTKDQLTSTTRSWAKQGLQKSHTTSGEILGLHNCAIVQLQTKDQLIMDNAGIKKKSRTTLGEIVGLHNCAVANIKRQLRSSAKRKDGEHDDHL